MTYYDRDGNHYRGRVVRGVALPREPRVETLRNLGVYRYVGQVAIPAGQRATGWHIEYDDEAMTCRRVPDATEPIPPDPVVTAIADQIRQVWTDLGVTPIPADWNAAMTALQGLPDQTVAMQAGLKLLALRQQLVEAGGSWDDVLNA